MKFAGKRQRFYLIKAYRRSKTLRFPFSGENCRWIVLWRHLYQAGAEGANGAQRLESLRQKDRGCFIIPADSYELYEQYFLNF